MEKNMFQTTNQLIYLAKNKGIMDSFSERFGVQAGQWDLKLMKFRWWTVIFQEISWLYHVIRWFWLYIVTSMVIPMVVPMALPIRSYSVDDELTKMEV